MKVVNQSVQLIDQIDGDKILEKLEKCGRICYKSEDRIVKKSSERFIRSIIDRGHESVLEHENITIKVITNRAISHQLVRHRLGSYSQESQRYCNYSKDKFSDEITVIKPLFTNNDTVANTFWEISIKEAEFNYFKLIQLGATPEEAREVLPNSTKTELIITHNIRSWRNLLKTRLVSGADPMMKELARMILDKFKENIDVVFDDIQVVDGN